ncbi:MAG: hypothetical protein JOZ80_04005 [Acidobacteriaceae bacterium]|nr:hypothetical protein [Acidobacteriaceae bacterium]
MRVWIRAGLVLTCLAGACLAQQDSGSGNQPRQADQQKSRERSAEAGESSSRDTRVDLSPPKDDTKNHPNSGGLTGASSTFPKSTSPEDMTNMTDVQEMHPWNPYRAAKDDEVGDYYLKQRNYKGALARYQDALIYKDNDAVANFRIAQCYEKLHQPEEAVPHYKEYLRILPEGPFAKQAKKALEKLDTKGTSAQN